MTELRQSDDQLVASALAGDEAAFADLTRRLRRELHLHCYRMVACFEEAEDLVQETFLRAWQKRSSFAGRGTFRAWLYRIATNACLDHLARHERRVVELSALGDEEFAGRSVPHVAWLQPYPDRLADALASVDADPSSAVLRKETIELAYLVALQHLPPKQRAVLILRDVLDLSAIETAEMLETTVAAVNGALQRARATVRDLRREGDSRVERPAAAEASSIVRRYVEATERCDVEELVRLVRRDARFSMPPTPTVYMGAAGIMQSMVEGGFGQPPYDDFRCLVTRANGMPAVANYLRVPGDSEHRAFSIDVLRIEEDGIAEIVAFDLAPLVAAFGLPRTLG